MNVVNPNPGSRPDPDQHRVAIYIRAADPFTLDKQRTALLTCVVTDQHPAWLVVAEFIDVALHSGWRHLRPGLQCLLKAAHAGAFDLLLVHGLDRLSRRVTLLHQILSHLDAAGVSVRTLADPAHPVAAPARRRQGVVAALSDHDIDHETGREDHR